MEPDEIIRALRLCADKSENFEECHSGQCDCPFGKTVIDCTERMNRAAADLIELLTDEIPHWIPVSERLPEADTPVICYCNNGHLQHLYQRVGYWSVDRSWHDSWDGREIPVTHWMPLPQPPKEEKRC